MSARNAHGFSELLAYQLLLALLCEIFRQPSEGLYVSAAKDEMMLILKLKMV